MYKETIFPCQAMKMYSGKVMSPVLYKFFGHASEKNGKKVLVTVPYIPGGRCSPLPVSSSLVFSKRYQEQNEHLPPELITNSYVQPYKGSFLLITHGTTWLVQMKVTPNRHTITVLLLMLEPLAPNHKSMLTLHFAEIFGMSCLQLFDCLHRKFFMYSTVLYCRQSKLSIH